MTPDQGAAPDDRSDNGRRGYCRGGEERPGGAAGGRGGRRAARPAGGAGPRGGPAADRGRWAVAAADQRVLESALEGEITDHLGYNKGPGRQEWRQPANGVRATTVLTDVGPVE